MQRHFRWLLAAILSVILLATLRSASAMAASASETSYTNTVTSKMSESLLPLCHAGIDGLIYIVGGNRYQCGCVKVVANQPCAWVWRNLDAVEYTLLQLDPGMLITNGPKAKLYFQPDGNLVVYDEFGRARWSSHTVSRGNKTLFQSDGNFVVYDGSGHPTWTSNTCCWSGNKLDIQTDGNVVIYNPFFFPLWSTNTNH